MNLQTKKTDPSPELINLFRDLVKITTEETGRRDWALIRFKNIAPFNSFTLKSLFLNKTIMQNTNEKNELLDRFRTFFIESDQTTEEAAVNMADLEKMSVKRLKNLCVNFNL